MMMQSLSSEICCTDIAAVNSCAAGIPSPHDKFFDRAKAANVVQTMPAFNQHYCG
jgi:hypothetical protein